MTSESGAAKGRRIDRYELHELIGEGGMGAVYRAVDSRLGRTVALKTVVPHRSGAGLSDELRQRFMREAQAASKVEHRNVVQVIDFGVTGDGTPYLVMEYLRGQDLGVLLRKSREPLAIEYVADVMLGVCAALRACHQLGIVHRDLKPSNIFLADTDTGHEIKVLDFGVSKAPMADDLTQEGQILGTPQYLSPEQVNGKVGPESDQYALGVLLYVCLTKRLPFEEHQNLSLLRAIEVGRFRGPRVHRPDIPAALEAIILRAMHADPAERFESVHVLGQRLWEFASSRGQVEWKNYYFHSPPVAMPAKSTLRGLPVPPGPAESVEGKDSGAPSGPVALLTPTELLAKSESGQPVVVSPQFFISTKLARPARDTERIGAELSPDDVGGEAASRAAARRRRAAIVAIFFLIVVGLRGFAYRRFRNSPPAVTPIATQAAPAPALPAAETPATVSRPPTELPTPVSPPAATAPPPSVRRSAVESPLSVSKRPARKKHATVSGNSSKMGLDQNGIGIPSN